ncbi:MAG TPA: signal peptidase II [Rhodocyclaceae bacterium]|nr:signal peptidase II [Rhodocyclaceae bacterium]
MSMTKSKRFILWLMLAVLVIGLDQISKQVVLSHLTYGQSIQVTGFFDLVLLYNPGAAFSFLANHDGWQRWFFIVLAFVICSWLIVLVRKHQAETLQPLAFSLVIGGALGNVIDRFQIGAVVDFLYFHIGAHGWPAFNLADSAICLGVGLMILSQLREARAAKKVSAS